VSEDGRTRPPDQHPLLWRAALSPAAPAIETARGAWTFGELADRARRGARYVRSQSPGDSSPIALLLEGSADFAAWFHAVALAGRSVLPLNLRLTAPEIARQLEDARVTCLLGGTGDARLATLEGVVPGLHAHAVPAVESLPACTQPLPGERAEPDAVLAVLFTSGTTGRAKGACLTRGNFAASAAATRDRLGPAVEGRWLSCMPLFHVGGLSILWRSLEFGAAVRLLPRFDAREVSEALDTGTIEGISLVPTMLSRLLEERAGRTAPPGLRVLLLGGAAASRGLLARALALGYPVCPTYGLTEATSQVASAAPPKRGATLPMPMLPLAATEVRIACEGHEAARGMPGEILVCGPTVMHGYLHRPDDTARVLRDGWLHTGDIGLMDADGGLRVLDRRDDLIVSGGENVYPAEVEVVLLEHSAVSEAGVAGVPDPDLGSRVVAWIVSATGAAPDLESLRLHCRERLAGFKQPREFRFVTELPRNSLGKLQRRRLSEAAPGKDRP
jgi:O-succinylbenzoic acid--CoA ligase